MLVLSRQEDESICIGSDIVVTVIRIGSDRVKLGISAPAGVSVHRHEVYQRIEQEQHTTSRDRRSGAS